MKIRRHEHQYAEDHHVFAACCDGVEKEPTTEMAMANL